jgi:hypothetical protein
VVMLDKCLMRFGVPRIIWKNRARFSALGDYDRQSRCLHAQVAVDLTL